MAEKKKKDGRGGARPGAGRKKSALPAKVFTFRANGELRDLIEAQEEMGEYIKESIRLRTRMDALSAENEPDFSKLGSAYRADMVKEVEVPFYDIGIVAGVPIPMNNDERSQTVGLLDMMCPDRESTYLINVKGNSMIDANVFNGDIVVVDKSNRNPSEHEMAVCELNGDCTLKYFKREGDEGWLIPANPDFKRIHVTADDRFAVWGVVRYVIHRA